MSTTGTFQRWPSSGGNMRRASPSMSDSQGSQQPARAALHDRALRAAQIARGAPLGERRVDAVERVEERAVLAERDREAGDGVVVELGLARGEGRGRERIAAADEGAGGDVDELVADLVVGVERDAGDVVRAAREQHRVARVAVARRA